jgi:type IV secretion system protein VirB8
MRRRRLLPAPGGVEMRTEKDPEKTRKAVEKKDFEKYLAEARCWETDKVAALLRSRRIAWVLCSLSMFLACLAVLAVAMLSPLKTVEPFVIRVDNATGAVDVVKSMVNNKTSYGEVVSRYFIQWYVRWREGYSRTLAPEYYTSVALMSAPAEQQRYVAFFNPKNPNSPLNLYGDQVKVTVKIKSLSFIRSNVALVRYIKESSTGQSSHWVTTLAFQFSGEPMSESDRAINPLGFQVTEYRNDPDDATPDPAPQRLTAPGAANLAPVVPALQ